MNHIHEITENHSFLSNGVYHRNDDKNDPQRTTHHNSPYQCCQMSLLSSSSRSRSVTPPPPPPLQQQQCSESSFEFFHHRHYRPSFLLSTRTASRDHHHHCDQKHKKQQQVEKRKQNDYLQKLYYMKMTLQEQVYRSQFLHSIEPLPIMNQLDNVKTTRKLEKDEKMLHHDSDDGDEDVENSCYPYSYCSNYTVVRRRDLLEDTYIHPTIQKHMTIS
jgi:hypothetical protein